MCLLFRRRRFGGDAVDRRVEDLPPGVGVAAAVFVEDGQPHAVDAELFEIEFMAHFEVVEAAPADPVDQLFTFRRIGCRGGLCDPEIDFAEIFRRIGQRGGLVILLDEMVNLYKIPNAVSRQYNYEKVLTMYNDTLQGKAHHLGIIMSGTPQAVEDRRRGLYSYEALRSRLTQGRFSQDGLVDMLAPVIRLEPLTHEELLVLVEKLADIHAGLFGYQRTITQDELVRFLETEYGRVGADSHLTPREVIRDFVEMLDILSQNPGVTVEQLLGSEQFTSPVKAPVEQDTASFAAPGGGQAPAAQDEFAEFDI